MLNIYDYVTNSRFFKTFKVDDLLFVEYKCLFRQDVITFWTHNNYFAYILSGSTKYTCGENEYTVSEGDAMFIRRGTFVATHQGNADYCALVIFLPDDFIKTVLDRHISSAVKPFKKTESLSSDEESIFLMQMDESLAAYFHSVLSYFTRDISPSPELLKIKFEELLLNVLTGVHNQSLASALRKIHATEKVSIRHVMETSFMYNMTLEEYARLCARSLSTFKADFYEIYKSTPGRWLMSARIQYAKLLLETSDEPINDVAFKSGFKNTTHFVRLFKDTYGMPPQQYRISCRNTAQQEEMELAR